MTRRRISWALVATLTAGGVGALPAQDRRLVERLGPETAALIAAQVDSAARERLPTEPLVQRALEGSARGASDRLIVAAVANLRRRLRAARDALGDEASEAEMTAGAGALAAGVEPTVLGALAGRRSGGAVAMALVVLADLVQRGVPADTASRIMVSLSEADVTEADIAAFRRLVESDILAGAAPAAAAAVRARGVILGLPRRPGGESDSLAKDGAA